jgi:hypothetical protein
MRILILFLFLSINYTASFAASKSIVGAKDTLKMLQGIWEFQGILIQADSNVAGAHHATDLHISNNRFQMNLSEASSCGAIVENKGRLRFVFDCEPSFMEDTIGNTWKNMDIISVTRNRLKLSMTGVDLSYFSTDLNGIGNVVFMYTKIRRKAKSFESWLKNK